jgi:hypothetical protein
MLLQIDKLTKDWTQKWSDWRMVMEYYSVDINKRRAGVVIDSSLPHLLVLEDDVLSTGVVLYHLKVRKLLCLLPELLTPEVIEGKFRGYRIQISSQGTDLAANL